jgi:hypothetical protein
LVSDIESIPFAAGQHIAGLAAHHRSITGIAKQKSVLVLNVLIYTIGQGVAAATGIGETVSGLI